MKRINLFFITIASMFVFSIQAIKLNQPDQLSDLNILAKCYCTLSKSQLLKKRKLPRGNGPVFKRSGRGTRRQRLQYTINRRLCNYTPVNTKLCREDGVNYLELLTKANMTRDQNIENQNKWERLQNVALDMMSIMRDIGSDDVARYIEGELIEAQYKKMRQLEAQFEKMRQLEAQFEKMSQFD